MCMHANACVLVQAQTSNVPSLLLPPPNQPSEDILLMAHRYSLYRQRTLQVHTLNPCFWSLRQRPMPPLTSLPTPIRSFCQDYQQFFVACEWPWMQLVGVATWWGACGRGHMVGSLWVWPCGGELVGSATCVQSVVSCIEWMHSKW